MLTPVFVYGTLRVGEGNYRWCADGIATDKTLQGARTEGDLYFVGGRTGSYPVANVFGSGTIVGDLLWFDSESMEYRDMCEMEFGARYVPVTRPVAHSSHTGWLHALVWHYPYYENCGAKIPHGDWCAATRRG